MSWYNPFSWFNSVYTYDVGYQPNVERWGNDYFILDPKSEFGTLSNDLEKIRAVFSNPAVLKVFKLQCDMFSLGEFYVYRNGKPMKNTDPFLNLIKNPNPFQQKQQFLWDFMFWKMLGNAYCYVDSDYVASTSNKLYFLDSSKMEFPDQVNYWRDRIVLSDASMDQINDMLINYTYAYGDSVKFKWSRISHVADLTNGIGNWFKGASAVDTLYEIISNGRQATNSKNINVRYAGKYMVAGQQDPNDTTKLPLSTPEQQDIETKMNGRKTVHAVKSMIDIKRFVEKADVMGQLDESWWDDYFKVGNMFGIPSEVLEAFNQKGATYENQEKARGAHVDYTLQPAADTFCAVLNKRFSYSDKQIVLSWDHLPFTKVFQESKANTDYKNSQTLMNLMKAGVPLDEINTILDTEFTELDYEAVKRANNQSGVSSQNQDGNQPAN